MPAHFQINAGPISIDVQLDDSGVRFQRTVMGREHAESIPWDKVTGATLVLPGKEDVSETQREQQIAKLFGAEAAAKYDELHGKVGQIFIAYRNVRNRLQQTEIPAPLADSAFLQEFKARLGPRWLGETADRGQVDKKLHTSPGFFKTTFVLIALLGIVAVVAVVGVLGLLQPALNLLSIQRMLLDLQDGNYVSLGQRVASYIALFVLGYVLHRAIRSKLDSMKGSRFPKPGH